MAGGGRYTDEGIERWAFMRDHTHLYWRFTARTVLVSALLIGVVPFCLYHGIQWGQIKRKHADVFVHAVRIGNGQLDDVRRTLYDSLDRQVFVACEQLASIPELQDGFDAIGLSQGGQLMRAYVQRCNAPPVRTLITLGAQHRGLASFTPALRRAWLGRVADWVERHAYSAWAQKRIVPAQYLRLLSRLDEYYLCAPFIARVNGEVPDGDGRDAEARKRLASLRRFAMFMFENDEIVEPRESSWFAERNDDGSVITMRDTALYREDWIGLRALDTRGAISLHIIPGASHMQLASSFVHDNILPLLVSDAD